MKHGHYDSWEAFWQHMAQKPDPKLVQHEKFSKSDYLAIEIIEAQLRQDFLKTEVFVEHLALVNDTVAIAVRVKLHLVIDEDWQTIDLTGMAGHSTNSAQKQVPAAHSFAKKQALKHLGLRYGGALNRKYEDTTVYLNRDEELLDQAAQLVEAGEYSEELASEMRGIYNGLTKDAQKGKKWKAIYADWAEMKKQSEQ